MNLKLVDGRELALPSGKDAAARYIADMFVNRGRLPDSDERVEWSTFAETISPKNRDLTRSSEITPLLQQSMEILIREPVEPSMIVTSLYTPVQAKGLNTTILAGAMGAVYAQDIQEHGTYPEVQFQVGGAMSTAHIGKSGIAASFTDEALRYSTWDIMATNLRLMGNAMVRLKEQKAVAFLKQLGTSLYDNESPATSLFGVCTGRDIALAANGSMRMDDLVRGIAHMSEEGFDGDTLLMHPLFYYAWLQDPVLRAMLLSHGGGSYMGTWTGNAGPQAPWSNGSMGGMGPSNGQLITPGGNAASATATGLAARPNTASSAPILPGYGPSGLRILTSPLCPFDPERNTGDIFLLSSGNVGFHLIDEGLTSVEWRDESVEVVKMKLRERYGFAVAHEGQGVGVFKNVKVTANMFDGTVQATKSGAAAISPTATIDLG